MFWIAFAISAIVGALVGIVALMVLGLPATAAGWGWTVALVVIGTWCGFVLLSLGLNMARGIGRGAQEADSARGARYEAHGRKAGKVVGTGLAKLTGRSPSPAPTEATTTDERAEPKPTLDDAARSLGMMIGRRIGERKDES